MKLKTTSFIVSSPHGAHSEKSDLFGGLLWSLMMMMHFLRSIVLLLALVKRGQSASLATPFDGKPDNEDASDGDKFSITTKDSAIGVRA